jgi:hypothetical protein
MQKVLFLVILFSQGLGSLAQDQNQLEGRVEVKVEQVNTLRETLVLGSVINRIFTPLRPCVALWECKSTDQEKRRVYDSTGVTQGEKPSHAADALELEAIEKFQKTVNSQSFGSQRGAKTFLPQNYGENSMPCLPWQ